LSGILESPFRVGSLVFGAFNSTCECMAWAAPVLP